MGAVYGLGYAFRNATGAKYSAAAVSKLARTATAIETNVFVWTSLLETMTGMSQGRIA